MEAPGEQNSGSEDSVIVEIDGGGRNGQKSALEQDCGGKQQYASGYNQGFQRSRAPEIHAAGILSSSRRSAVSNYLRRREVWVSGSAGSGITLRLARGRVPFRHFVFFSGNETFWL